LRHDYQSIQAVWTWLEFSASAVGLMNGADATLVHHPCRISLPGCNPRPVLMFNPLFVCGLLTSVTDFAAHSAADE
jgi:hypothetical protein